MYKPKPLLKSEKEVLLWQDKSEKAVLKALEKHYQEAIKGINARIAELMGRNDANLPHVIRRIEYQRMIQQQVKAALDMLHAKEYETISKYLDEAYKNAFVGAAYTQHNQDMPVIVAIDQNAVIKAVTIDTKLKAPLYEALGVDVAKLKKVITNEITRGIASGMLFDDISRNIADKTYVPMKRARTIVRTEAGRVMEQATMDEAVKAKKAGADVVKQWSAIRDGRTRDSHRKLDGQIRELDEYFEVDGHKAMHPHGFGLASEDVNCRCTMLTRARAALDEDEYIKLKERAKFFDLDKSDELEAFKKKYLKAAETVAEEPAFVFVPATTIEAAEKAIGEFYNEKQFGALGVSYKGVSLDVANEINSALIPLYREFDVEPMGGIIAPAGNTKLGQQISGAIAGYSPIRKGYILNRKSLKNIKTAKDAFEGESAVLKNLLEHPERYDFTKVSKSTLGIIERAKVSGRATVPRTIPEALQHEFGHALERRVKASEHWTNAEKNMAKYADRISGYAGANAGEYIAESFVSFKKGEGLADPVLVQIFESLRRK